MILFLCVKIKGSKAKNLTQTKGKKNDTNALLKQRTLGNVLNQKHYSLYQGMRQNQIIILLQ